MNISDVTFEAGDNNIRLSFHQYDAIYLIYYIYLEPSPYIYLYHKPSVELLEYLNGLNIDIKICK